MLRSTKRRSVVFQQHILKYNYHNKIHRRNESNFTTLNIDFPWWIWRYWKLNLPIILKSQPYSHSLHCKKERSRKASSMAFLHFRHSIDLVEEKDYFLSYFDKMFRIIYSRFSHCQLWRNLERIWQNWTATVSNRGAILPYSLSLW